MLLEHARAAQLGRLSARRPAGSGMNWRATALTASRSQRSAGPQTWITIGAPGFATRPASRSAATMSVAKKNALKPATRSKLSSS